MVERVWYKPPEGKLVPRAPGQMAREYFPPEGDWTEPTNFITRQLARGDGTAVPGGDEKGLMEGQARRDAERVAAEEKAEEEHRRVHQLNDPAVVPSGPVVEAADTVPAAKPADRAERIAAAKEKLGYTAPLNAPKPKAAADGEAAATATTERK